MYYQPFGHKVVSKTRKDPFTNKKAHYNPRLDGALDGTKLDWNLVDRKTGKPTQDLSLAANEILWVPKHHPNTIYYGLTDVIPALGHLLANIHIRDFFLQFFEHNAVPQYAVIVEGAKLADPVKETIMKFFAQDVKGSAHKTLIIPVPSAGGEVKVRFEKLNGDTKEGSFQATRKNNTQGIMTAHGVSPAIIGIADAANLGSGKGLSQAEIYKDRIVTPSQKRWERVLSNLFRLGLGVSMVKLYFDPLDIRDLEAEMRVWQGYSTMGAVTTNEIRKYAKIGDPIKGGDVAFIKAGPAGVMPIDSIADNVDAIIENATRDVSQIREKMMSDDDV
jgi:capsid portal protein